jgi:hypothetical protein
VCGQEVIKCLEDGVVIRVWERYSDSRGASSYSIIDVLLIILEADWDDGLG